MRVFLALFLLVSVFLPALGQDRPRRVSQSPPAPPQMPQERQNRAPGQATEEVDENDVIRVNTTLVTVPVSVMDRDGKYVPNLRQQDFTLFEDGVEQQISYFASVDEPFTVALVVDTSGSTHFKLEEIQEACYKFVDQLREKDRVMVVSFDEDIKLLSEATSDQKRLYSAIRRLNSGGGTRLYDTIEIVMNNYMERIEGRKAIVLFTDGVDTMSRDASYASNIRDAQEMDALIYPIQYDTWDDIRQRGPQTPQRWPYPRRQIPGLPFPFPWPFNQMAQRGSSRGDYATANAYLRDLAQNTGTRVYQAENVQNLDRSFAMIAEELRRQYSIGYYPASGDKAARERQIKVRVNRPNLVAKARTSYRSKSGGVAQKRSNLLPDF
jgi:Ca-activated chloride channel homolog